MQISFKFDLQNKVYQFLLHILVSYDPKQLEYRPKLIWSSPEKH